MLCSACEKENSRQGNACFCLLDTKFLHILQTHYANCHNVFNFVVF